MTASERLPVYLTKAEKNKIMDEAEKHGLSASRFLRMVIIQHIAEDIRERNPGEDVMVSHGQGLE